MATQRKRRNLVNRRRKTERDNKGRNANWWRDHPVDYTYGMPRHMTVLERLSAWLERTLIKYMLITVLLIISAIVFFSGYFVGFPSH